MQISSSPLQKTRRSPETPGEVIHTGLEGTFHPIVTGLKFCQIFVDEATPGNRARGLKTRDAAVNTMVGYIDEIAREKTAMSGQSWRTLKIRQDSTHDSGTENQAEKLTASGTSI